jgi:Na+/H+ antiporter NhaD/arsenite permease-like protein
MRATIGLWVPVITLTIIVHVVFNAINAIVTKQDDVPPADERDKLIELKATRNTHYLFIVGFFIAMVFLAFSTAPFVVFNLLIFAFVASELLGYASQLYYYRRGF